MNATNKGRWENNRERYKFEHATTYQAIDIDNRAGVSIVGDVHDSEIFSEAHFDCILAFNVFEHLYKPWVVAENIFKWLVPAGSVFIMVPTTQRVHHSSQDFRRLLPDGLRALFDGFENQQIVTFGNPLVACAALFGLAAEELAPEQLESHHADYPVITCLTARKPASE